MRPFAKTLAFVAALAAAVLNLGQPAPAAATGLPTYCGGALVTLWLHRQVFPSRDGQTAQVMYRGELQNRDPERRTLWINVDVMREITIGGTTFRVFSHLGSAEFDSRNHTIYTQLLTIGVNNQGGHGAPAAAQAAAALQIRCRFM